MSKIRLYGDTSGYVDLTAPAVADNRSIDLPGVLDSKLDIAGGKILQVVSAIDDSGGTTSTTTTFIPTYTTATITPSNISSKILILAHGDCYMSVNESLYATIYRNGTTNIGGGQTSSLQSAWFNANRGLMPCSFNLVDSPNTVSPVTYTVYIRNGGQGTTGVVWADVSKGSITLLEVSG